MATDLASRKPTSKNEAYLDQSFKNLCARIRRNDLAAWILILALVVAAYALGMGWFDYFYGGAGGSWETVFRWTSYGLFLGTALFLLSRTVGCLFRPINPYYVAHQLEGKLTNPKNSLINWLDLRDVDMPSAFRKNLSESAVESFEGCDAQQTIRNRGNRGMLGGLSFLILGLVILFGMGPAAFFASMMQAFVPFLDAERPARTRIFLIEPESGDAEVDPTQPIRFLAKIEGSVPGVRHPDGPRLLYRYQANDDYLPLPLGADGGGFWSAQMPSEQVRTGFWYKISAGDASTPEFQVRVRTHAHVNSFAITYLHRPFRNIAKTTSVFPNKWATAPSIRGPRGTEVELVVHANRPVMKTTVTILAGKKMMELSPRILPDDPRMFACRFPLEESGKFRVTFTSVEGEENSDREVYDIDVLDDAVPTVHLTTPGKDTALPTNGVLELEGNASSVLGIKSMALHLRVALGPTVPLQPIAYRPEASLRFADGSYPETADYVGFVNLNQIPKEKGGTHEFAAGTVLEYWLEANDAADYPSAAGNVGKSPVYKLTLLAASKDVKKMEEQRKKSQQKQNDLAKKQDEKQNRKKDKDNKQQDGSGAQNPDEGMKKETDAQKEQINKAKQDQEKDKERGGSKGAEQNQGDAKPEPQASPNAPEAKNKDQAPKDAGNAKNAGEGSGSSGGAKDGGEKDKNEKNAKEPPPTGESKGIDQEGPGTKNKDSKDDTANDPGAAAKPGPGNDPGAAPGDAKQATPDQMGEAGQARGDDTPSKKMESPLEKIERLIQQLPDDGAAKQLAEIAKGAKDESVREFAKEVLEQNDRDPNTGKRLEPIKGAGKGSSTTPEMKEGKNPYGSAGQSPGIGDHAKAEIANREFLRRVGQMQLDDWKKQVSPELLKRAGMTDADWQRFLRNAEAYDASVRRLNAKLARETERRGDPKALSPGGRNIESNPATTESLDGFPPAPPDLKDALRRFSTQAK